MDTDTGIAATPARADAAGERPPVGCVVIEGVEVQVERENVAAETTGEGEGEGEGNDASHVATDRDNCDAVIVVGQKADRLDAAYKMFRGSTTRRGRGRAAAAPTARTEAEEDAYDEFSELDSDNKDQKSYTGERSAGEDEDDGSRDDDEDDGSRDDDEDDGSRDDDEDDGSHDDEDEDEGARNSSGDEDEDDEGARNSAGDEDEDEEENEEESVASPVVAAAANPTRRPPVRVPSKVVAVAVKRPERLTLRTVAASADTNTTRRGPRVSSEEAVVAPVNKQPRRRPPPAPASPAPRRKKQHPGRHAEKVKDRGAEQEEEDNFFDYPAARSRVDVIVQEEVKIRRLRQLRDIFDSSPYFDLQDISSISAEIFESEQEIKHLLAPLSDAEKEVLGMQVTIKQRELMIEKAVANNLLVPRTDNVFQTLVTKQVRLLKLVTRFSAQ
jgi:hypothetical protein